MFDIPYEADFGKRQEALADDMFSKRWSPRAMEKIKIPEEILEIIFDAARWSPSAFNAQPWRIFTTSDETDFERFLGLLLEQNRTWAKNAAILGILIADNILEQNGKTNDWALYDCGFAWASITFQANRFGLYTRGLAGIDKEKVYSEFNIPKDRFTVIAGFAIGKLTTATKLPANLQTMEAPTARKPLDKIYFPGGTRL